MGAIYWRPPSEADLAHVPWRKASDFASNEPVVEVWEENWAAVELFIDHMTQWRCGPSGPIGLDYTVLHGALGRDGVTGEEFKERMREIGILESAALAIIHK